MDVTFAPLDDDAGANRAALVEFFTSNEFPFHVVPSPSAQEIERRLGAGAYGDADHQALWVDVGTDLDLEGARRVGIVVLEDLSDGAPLFDLRLASRYRGRGLGVPILRAITSHVFTSMPGVNRFEGQTREDNIAMRKTFLRAGFIKEAHYREAWPVSGGRARASVAYAILRRDWETGETTRFDWEDLSS